MMIKTPDLTMDNFFSLHLKNYDAYQTQYLQSLSSADPLLLEAIQYVFNTPGKKFRAMMVYACGEIFALPSSSLHPLALAIELIHAYSLVHDDLPAMDNDDFRRGQPSCHKAFDEATAILTGNALHHLAFTHLLATLPSKDAIAVSKLILEKIGIEGILSGQNLDLKSLKNADIDLETLKHIHYLKTTTLLEAISLSVAIMANANALEKQALVTYCRHLGLAYQMLDDYGDYYASASWGKGQASDIKNKKFTFVQFYHRATLEHSISEELRLAKESLLSFKKNHALLDLCRQIASRLNAIQQNN